MKKEVKTGHLDKILVVDDTTANLQLLTHLLTGHGYTVYPASDGELALEFVRSTLPDLILLDIRLPGIDGYEVCRRLKADDRTRSIPIIFISIIENEHEKVMGFHAGAVDYITKPFQAEEVLARVRSHLHLRELTEHLERTVAERTEELHAANAQLHRELAERKQAEEVLRASEREKTIQNQIAGIFLTIPDEAMFGEVMTVILQAVESKFGIFGYIGETGDLIIPSMTREIWNECRISDKAIVFPSDSWGHSLWGRAIREQKAFYCDGPFHTPEGHIHIEHFLSVPIVYGQETIGLISVANKEGGYTEADKNFLERIVRNISPILHARFQRDTEERMRLVAEEDLRESEEKYRSMMESISDPVYIASPGYEVEYMNRAMILRTGHDGTGELCYRVIHGLDEKCPHCSRDRILEGLPFEEEISSPRDESIYHVINSPIFKTDGSISKLTIFRDITDRMQAEEERQQLQAQLIQAQKMEAIGTLTGGISHDFNNLLQAISGYVQILLFDITENDPMFPSLKAIQNAGNRAAELVRQLLFFSRKAATERQPVILNQIIEQAQGMLKRTIPKMIDIEVRLGDHLCSVNADHVQMEQIILNLGTNAADAMPDGGKLIIETENVILDAVFARKHLGVQPGKYVLLMVSDTGQGMDKETQDKIFEPFFTTKGIGKGTGLGLASVYGIVKSHGGNISCYSEIGQGTTFKIYLPVIEREDLSEDQNLVAKNPNGGTETILVVDDEEWIKDLAAQILAKFGYALLLASSSEEALEIYSEKSNDIDLVILDIGMPGMGGHRCFQELLRLDSEVKVLIASGYSMNGQVRATLEAGAMGYIGKPYKVADLLNKVRQVLDEGR